MVFSASYLQWTNVSVVDLSASGNSGELMREISVFSECVGPA
jgi:hypothetical protein